MAIPPRLSAQLRTALLRSTLVFRVYMPQIELHAKGRTVPLIPFHMFLYFLSSIVSVQLSIHFSKCFLPGVARVGRPIADCIHAGGDI